ncbi:MAG: CPXCG motif-containing cysteine-rich protein [Flavobacteriaceae bacterium]|nr:CPXCG motif-containing cysteine-rich protein [Flavobacteriaceae bacterium]
MKEHFFQCPYCWETISMLLDISQNNQSYIEDCEVCCHPIRIKFLIENDTTIQFEALNVEQ